MYHKKGSQSLTTILDHDVTHQWAAIVQLYGWWNHRILAIPADHAVIQSCDASDGFAMGGDFHHLARLSAGQPFGEMSLEISHRNLACDYF